MIAFLIKRISTGILILFSVVTVVFFLFSFSFPNPEKMAVGQRTDVETQEAIKKEFGLDKPLFTQYALFLNDISPLSFHSDEAIQLQEKYNIGGLVTIGSTSICIKETISSPLISKQRTNRSVNCSII